MNKIQKLIKGLGILIKHPVYLNKIINDNDAWRVQFGKRYPQWMQGLPVVDLPLVIGTSDIGIECYSYLNGGSLPTDLALLKGLALSIDDCRYFEIGTWRGESAVNVCGAAQQCVTFNLDEEGMMAAHGKRRVIDQVGMFIGPNHNVTQVFGDSMTFDFAALGQKFDLVFIDGDHRYEAIVNDTQKVFKKLLHENSIVVWHDYTYSPDVIRYEVLKAVLDGIPDDFKEHLYHVRNTNCCIYHPRLSHLPSRTLEFPDFPYYNFKVDIHIEPFDRKS